jgi:hypothetical protein
MGTTSALQVARKLTWFQVDKLQGLEFDIVKAVAIDNPGLSGRFSNALNTMADRHKCVSSTRVCWLTVAQKVPVLVC